MPQTPKSAPPNDATFRRLALAFPGAFESSHMGSPDFRIGEQKDARIFATLAYGAKGLGTLKLTPEQQADFLAEAPEYFTPAPGGWGRMGMTFLHLNEADESIMAGALKTAYQNLQEKQSQKKSRKKSPAKTARKATPARTPRRPLQ